METIIHFIIFLTAVIEIVLLVRFFALCNHVEEIKKKMVPNENFQAMFLLYCSTGEKDKAKELLLHEISLDKLFTAAFFSVLPEHDKAKQAILTKYGKLLKMVDVTLDFDTVDKYLKGSKDRVGKWILQKSLMFWYYLLTSNLSKPLHCYEWF